MATSVDFKTLSGFHEEARGYLAPMDDCLAIFRHQPGDGEALCEMHRLAHLIRGASGVVGLPQLTAVSEGLEIYLDDIASGAIEWDDQTLAILEEATEAIRMNLQMAVLQPQAPVEFAAAVTPGFSEVDESIIEGFLIEAGEALQLVSGHLRILLADPDNKAVLLDVRRAVHTIKGAGGMVGLHALSSVAHRMEDLLDGLYEGSMSLEPAIGDLLHFTSDLMLDLIAAGGTSVSIEATIPDLFSRYRQLSFAGAASSATEPLEAPQELASFDTSKYVRVPLDRVDDLIRMVSELFVHRSIFERTFSKLGHEVGELSLSLKRLKQIGVVFEDEQVRFQSGSSTAQGLANGNAEFDPLEFDRYTQMHAHSRDLNETSADVGAVEVQMRVLAEDFDSYLSGEKRLTSQIQDRLMRFRMVPLSAYSSRLHRTVRSATAQTGKLADLVIEGSMTELDKTVLERMAGPLEHLLRNAVAHGVESREDRLAAGKPARGQIEFSARHEGAQIVLQLSDDGGGLQLDLIRAQALKKGLIAPEQADSLATEDIYRLLFLPGFSTSEEVTELSGRGVGLDVVKDAVEALKGTLSVESIAGEGTSFLIRLPMTLAIARVLIVESQQQQFALPITAVREVARIDIHAMEQVGEQTMARFGNRLVPLHGLSEILRLKPTATGDALAPKPLSIPVALLRNGDADFALSMDRILEARDVVVKPLSNIIGRAHHLAGATVMGDGRIVPILSPSGLSNPARLAGVPELSIRKAAPQRQGFDILIVDDSLSVRRVIANLMQHQGWTQAQAKDGVEALEYLQKVKKAPDLILMDVEMPRMDGFELTAALRAMTLFREIPIVMLTSRSGEKHRVKALSVGVTDYLVKPYQEEHLLATIRSNIEKARRLRAS